VLDALPYVSNNVATKFGVNFVLFGRTVLNVGTQKHIDFFAPRLQSNEVIGCFCLTELGHGSNARDIETTATYDAKTQEFVLNTPNNLAQKYWIGGLAMHATHAVVFAQLTTSDGQARGVHAFVVELRRDGKLTENIIVEDCGPKAGLNGVDNGASAPRVSPPRCVRHSAHDLLAQAACGSRTSASRARACSTSSPMSTPTAPTACTCRTCSPQPSARSWAAAWRWGRRR
jgi:hypothetical protein